MDTKLSYNCLKPHLLNLRIAGCFYIDKKSPKLYKFLHLCFISVTFACMNIYLMQQAIKVFKVRNNMDEVTGTMFLFLTHSDSVYKQVVMLVRANDVQELLDIMKGPLFNQGEADHKKYLTQIARHGKFFLRTHNYMALCTCFLWVLYPLILHIQGKHTDFAIWLPYDININYKMSSCSIKYEIFHSICFLLVFCILLHLVILSIDGCSENSIENWFSLFGFYLTALYVWIVTSWFAFCNTSIDVTVAFLWGQCKAQLSILRNDLLHLIERARRESLATNEDFADVLNRRFKNIVKHHIQILYFNKRVQDIFGSTVAYQFIISGWIICTSVYKMVDADPTTVQFWSMVLYICCILMEVFIYCFYGNELTHESLKLTEFAYAMEWLGSPIKHQRNLLLFMERIKKPIQPLAGIIIPLSNNTFISILKSSYSFYALLRNTDRDT